MFCQVKFNPFEAISRSLAALRTCESVKKLINAPNKRLITQKIQKINKRLNNFFKS